MMRRRVLLSIGWRIPTIVVKKLQVREIGAVKFETFVKIIILTTVSNFTAPISRGAVCGNAITAHIYNVCLFVF